jgi:hypothetical protein
MVTVHVATINAFANKFGTFTGAILDKASGEVVRERFPTFDEARNWVRIQAWERYGECNYAAMRRRGEYLANVWVTK